MKPIEQARADMDASKASSEHEDFMKHAGQMKGLKRSQQFLLCTAVLNFMLFCFDVHNEHSRLAFVNMGSLLFSILGAIKISDFIFKIKEVENGLYRRTAAEVHIDPTERTAIGAAGEPARAIDPYPILSGPFGSDPTSGAVERAGIVLGEVLAYRCWQVAGDFILSMNGAVWIPGEPMVGIDVDVRNSNGIHAFKSIDAARTYARCFPIVIGIVKLWGTVVEHELGYRGELAKPVKFIEVIDGNFRLDALSHHYELDQI